MRASPVDPVLTDLNIACDELNRRGFSARVVGYHIVGELDVRLRARLPGRAIAVEVLEPWQRDSEPPPECWQAVRISPSAREVWVGPPRSQAPTGLDLSGFVKELLCRDQREVAARYQRAG